MTYLKPETRTYFFQTLDPLHVGTGGTRLGRVDNTVARDPVTRLPKVPGSGLSGAVKDAYDLHTLLEDSAHRPMKQRCAGAQGCGKKECRVCAMFGSSPPEGKGGMESRRGVLAFRDALLAAMPVAALTGPVWISEPEFAKIFFTEAGKFTLAGPENPTVAAPGSLRVEKAGNAVNLGSFLLPCPNDLTLKIPDEKALAEKIRFLNASSEDFRKIIERMVICHPSVFPLLADTAMEVRTSVTIDPETGAAEERKLFTMEAVPAGAIFRTELNYLGGKYPEEAFGNPTTGNAQDLFQSMETYGFPYLSMTGIGGSVTRGFGRVRFLGCLINGKENK